MPGGEKRPGPVRGTKAWLAPRIQQPSHGSRAPGQPRLSCHTWSSSVPAHHERQKSSKSGCGRGARIECFKPTFHFCRMRVLYRLRGTTAPRKPGATADLEMAPARLVFSYSPHAVKLDAAAWLFIIIFSCNWYLIFKISELHGVESSSGAQPPPGKGAGCGMIRPPPFQQLQRCWAY